MSLSGGRVAGVEAELALGSSPDRGVAAESQRGRAATGNFRITAAPSSLRRSSLQPSSRPFHLNVTSSNHIPKSFNLPHCSLSRNQALLPTDIFEHPYLGDCLIPSTSQHGEPASTALLPPSQLYVLTRQQPSATGSSWEKYQKNYADDEVEEKKITPLSDESVPDPTDMVTQFC